MTTAKPTAGLPQTGPRLAMPDPPEREPDDMTSFDHLAATGSVYLLIHHLGNPETTIVGGEHYLTRRYTTNLAGVRYPDLYIAFGVDPEAYHESNAYLIAEQGKPPDFVLEIASRRTGREDTGKKRDDYQDLGIPEYWRFDETGRYHRTRLAGDRLVNGVYQPIPITEIESGVLQGYSEVLNLCLSWENGQLKWRDPATGQTIATLEDEMAARAQAEARAMYAEARADQAEARADQAEARAAQAEDRERELKEEIRRLRNT